MLTSSFIRMSFTHTHTNTQTDKAKREEHRRKYSQKDIYVSTDCCDPARKLLLTNFYDSYWFRPTQ